MVSLFDWLIANGITNLTGWTLTEAMAISADGNWVVGYGYNPFGQSEAFIADITVIPVPAAAWFMASGLVVVGFLRRRMRSSRAVKFPLGPSAG
jgi:hypothetical protein